MAKAKPQPIDWQNRIVEYGQQTADQFLAHDLNARRHPNAQRDALRGSLNAVGWIAPVIVSQRSGKLLDGHARIEEALSRSESALVPYVLVDVTEAEEAIILGTFDPITGMATYDREVLDALLREIETNDAGLQNLLEDLAAKQGLIPGNSVEEVWQGMPEYNQPDAESFRRIIVHFDTSQDVEAFARAVNQTITEKTKFIWFPYKAPENLKEYVAE